MSADRLLILDCDSTLCSIEGIDELGAHRSAETREAVAAATTEAMEGKIRVEDVFGRRLELLQPSKHEVEQLADQYIETMLPEVPDLVETMRANGWDLLILSGGLRPAIMPLAEKLGIQRVEAVDITFDDNGHYLDFDRAFPTTRSHGKPEFVRQLREKEPHWQVIAMVGDGVSDLETLPVVDQFIGFGGVVEREKVKTGSTYYTHQLADIPQLLLQPKI